MRTVIGFVLSGLCCAALLSAPLQAGQVGSLCLAETNDVSLYGDAKISQVQGGKSVELRPEEPEKYATVAKVELSGLKVGEIQLRIEKPLFSTLDVKVTIVAGRKTYKAITLEPARDNVANIRIVDEKGGVVKGAQLRRGQYQVWQADDGGKASIKGYFTEANGNSCTVEAEGYEWENVSIPVKDRPKGTTVKLKQATRIQGRVKGLKGVREHVQAAWGEVGKRGKRQEAEGELIADGTYSVTLRKSYGGTFNGGDIDITLTHLGLTCTGKAPAVKAGSWVTLDLECSPKATGSIRGTVLGIDGKPLPGLIVKIGGLGYARGCSAETNAKGEYIVPLVPTGEYEMEIDTYGKGRGNRAYARDWEAKAKVFEGEETTFDFDYTGALMVRCRFINDNTFFSTLLVDRGSATVFMVDTDERYECWFELYGADPVQYEFRLRGNEKSVVQTIDLPESDKVIELDRLMGKVSVKGRLTFPAGEPKGSDRSKWKVELYERYSVCAGAPVDKEGNFEFAQAIPGEFHIAANVPGYYSEWLPIKVENDVVQDLEMKVAASVCITANFNGLQIDSLMATVIFSALEDDRPLPWPQCTFKDGVATLACESLPPGKTMVRINSQNFPRWKKGVKEMPLMRIEDQEVVLSAGAVANVSIQLRPAAEIRVTGLPGGMDSKETWLEDENGNRIEGLHGPEMGADAHNTVAKFYSLESGTYILIVEKSGYKKVRQKLELKAGNVEKVEVKLERDK